MKDVTYIDIWYRGEKSGCRAETIQKQRGDKKGLHTGPLDSVQKCDWVVGLPILTMHQKRTI